MRSKRLNFITADLRPKLEVSYELISVGVIVLSILYVSISALQIKYAERAKTRQLADLNAKSAELSLKISQLTEISQNKEKSNQVLGELQKVLSRKSYWSELFKELSMVIPDEVWLTNFINQHTEKADQLILKGQAPSQKAVAEFLTILEKSHHFQGVKIKTSERDQNVAPARYSFEFSIPVRTVAGGGDL